jgi:hypothetical protein
VEGRQPSGDGASRRACPGLRARNEMITQDQRRSAVTCCHGMVAVGSWMRQQRKSGFRRGRRSIDQVEALRYLICSSRPTHAATATFRFEIQGLLADARSTLLFVLLENMYHCSHCNLMHHEIPAFHSDRPASYWDVPKAKREAGCSATIS